MNTTSVFAKNIEAYNNDKRIIVNKGSTRSSKTWSLLQLLYLIAYKSETPRLISIVSESMPHLKRGCIRDFQNMLTKDRLWDIKDWNATDKIYKIGKSKIEFFSADDPGKVHGPARDILFINECNNIGYETYRQLAIRTTETIFLDYNPVEDFWVDEKVLIRPESVLIHSTYLDNEFLTKVQIEEIESNKHDTNWWNIYGLGITGSREGYCIKNWRQVDEMPSDYKYRWVGLDFGFTNDPTAIVDVRLSEGQLWVDEICYKSGMTNPMIADELRINNLLDLQVTADSAEPKSIAELRALRCKVDPAEKGADSVISGIDILNRYTVNVTKRSLNLIKEYRNYKYKQDKDGNYLNTPIDKHNHGVDATRYVVSKNLAIKRKPKRPTAKTTSIM